MADEVPRAHITLNADAVVAPALIAMRQAAEAVYLGLNPINVAELPEVIKEDQMMTFDFSNEKIPANERTSRNTAWLIAKAFQELALGVRRSLEEAFIYLKVYSLRNRSVTYGEFQEVVGEARSWANKANFPQLLGAVNEMLPQPLTFAAEFESLNRVRNCLEHRGGMVTRSDLDDKSDVLSLRLPKVRMFAVQDDKEVDLHRGMYVEKDTMIGIKREIRTRQFKLGERIEVSVAEFQEIAFALQFFAHDLGSKLPKT